MKRLFLALTALSSILCILCATAQSVPPKFDVNTRKAGTEGQEGLFASAVIDKTTNEIIVKIVTTSDKTQRILLNLNGLSKKPHEGVLTTYRADDIDGENSLDNPTKYTPQSSAIVIDSPNFEVEITAKSFAMYKIKK